MDVCRSHIQKGFSDFSCSGPRKFSTKFEKLFLKSQKVLRKERNNGRERKRRGHEQLCCLVLGFLKWTFSRLYYLPIYVISVLIICYHCFDFANVRIENSKILSELRTFDVIEVGLTGGRGAEEVRSHQ